MQYERIAGEVADLVTDEGGVETFVDEGDMRMAEIEYGAHKDLCKSLGIKKVPSVHFYSSGKKVDGFPCGPKKLPMLLEKLSHYRTLSLPELSFEADMNEGAGLGATVLSTLCKEEDKSKAAQCLAELNN